MTSNKNSLNSFNKIKYNLSKEIINKYKSLYEKEDNNITLNEFLMKNAFNIIEESGLFDDEWYIKEYPDVISLKWTPLEHYLKLGVQQKCNPNCFFDSDWYLKTYPVVQEEGLNPLFHFIVYGIDCGYFCSFEDYKLNSKENNSLLNSAIKIIRDLNLFDEDYYLNKYPDVKKSNIDAFDHYLKYGYKEGRNPSSCFDTKFYLNKYPDVVELGMNPLVHYALYGRNEGRLINNNLKLHDKLVNQNSNLITQDFYRAIEYIKKFNLFDEEYYLRTNIDVLESGMNPLSHYLLYGFKEGRNPSPLFNTDFYLRKHTDVRLANMNPLIHYGLYGILENRPTNPEYIKIKNYNFFSVNQVNMICQNYDRIISIIIDLSNDYEQIKNCLDSIIENTDNFELILIGDLESFGSKLKKYLQSLKISNDVIFVKNNSSLNLVKSLNNSLMSSNNDVVILKSSVVVTPGWLRKLKVNAYSDSKIATISPLLNSMNLIKDVDETPYLTLKGISRLIEKNAMHMNINVPVNSNSCLYIKREAILDVGLFNEDLDYYSTLSDFCTRLLDKNWCNIIDDSTYVFEEETESKEQSSNKNIDIVKSIKNTTESFEYKLVHNNLIYSVDNVSCDLNKINILYVILGSEENVWNIFETHNHLLSGLNNIESYLLRTTDYGFVLYKEINNNLIEIKEWHIEHSMKTYDEEYRKIYFNILYNLNVDLVQIDSLIDQTYDLPFLTNLVNIPLILTISDYYYINPLIMNKVIDFDNSDEFLDNWHLRSQNLLDMSSIIITSSENLSKAYQKIFPNIKTNFKTIMNGYRFNNELKNITKPKKYLNNYRPVKILILGKISPKYASLIHEINNLDNKNHIEFNFLSGLNDSLKNEGIFHSLYNDFNETIQKISPSFICLLSKNSTDLLIASSYGIPVIMLDDHINNHFELNGVIVVDDSSPQKIYDEIMNIISDEDKYDDLINETELISIDNVKMAKKYENIYHEILDNNIYILQSFYDLNENLNNGTVKFNDFKDFLSNLIIKPTISYPLNNDGKRFLDLTNLVKESLKKYLPTENPLVSIIMPTYNRKKVISNSINSVLNQTYSNFELLIIDDASTDDTLSFLNDFNDSRISIFSNNMNKGASYSRNVGLKNAKGEYIFYLDSDNSWQEDYLEVMVASYNRLPDADAVYCGQYLYTNYDDVVPYNIRYGSMNRSMLYNCNYIDLNCFSHKKSICHDLKGFDESLNSLIDWDFVTRVSSCYKIYSIPVILSNYYSNNDSNRITNMLVDDEAINRLNNNFVQYNENYVHVPIKQIRDLIIIIPNVDSHDLLIKCLNSSNVFKREKVRIIVLYNYDMNLIEDMYKQYDITFVEHNLSKNFSKNMFDLFNSINIDSDVVILNNLAMLNNNTLDILHEYAYKLEDSGILIPQQIIDKDDGLIHTFMSYSRDEFSCDIALSDYHTKIINMPLYSSGEYYELSMIPFFCTYIKKDLMEKIKKLNLNIDNSQEFINVLSAYVYEFTDYKIYYVSKAKAYYNIRGY